MSRLIVLVVLFLARGVLAQESRPLPASAAFSDEVELSDGSIYRGMIAESNPKEYLVFITMTGKTIRFSAGQIVYAGPLRKKQGEETAENTSAGAEIIGKKVALVFESPQQGLGLFVHSHSVQSHAWVGGKSAYGRSDGYSRLCNAPCKLNIVEGNYRLGLQLKDEIVDAGTIDIREPLAIKGELIDRSKERTVIQVSFAVSLALGVILSFFIYDPDTESINFGTTAGSASCLLFSLALGILNFSYEDKAIIKITPLN